LAEYPNFNLEKYLDNNHDQLKQEFQKKRANRYIIHDNGVISDDFNKFDLFKSKNNLNSLRAEFGMDTPIDTEQPLTDRVVLKIPRNMKNKTTKRAEISKIIQKNPVPKINLENFIGHNSNNHDHKLTKNSNLISYRISKRLMEEEDTQKQVYGLSNEIKNIESLKKK
jgi:hypothetical protein